MTILVGTLSSPSSLSAQTTSAKLESHHAFQAKEKLQRCRHPHFPQEVYCGVIKVPLDWNAINNKNASSKQIDIHYVVLPSQDKNKFNDAVFLLAGGPGQSAINAAGFADALLKPLNRRRDIVLVDQRGTGKTANLSCDASNNNQRRANTEEIIKEILTCKNNLQKLPHGELDKYTTSFAAKDLDAVREARAYPILNLMGASYGTRLGLEYLRQFPHRVRRLVLDGVVPPDLNNLSGTAHEALQAVFKACDAEEKCKVAYGNLAQTWQHLLQTPAQDITFPHPVTGAPYSMRMEKENIIMSVFGSLYANTSTAMLPYAITQADKGNFLPLINLHGGLNRPSPLSLSMGMHYSVWCSEAYSAHSQSIQPVQAMTLNEKDEFSRIMVPMYERICKEWPKADIEKAFYSIPPAPAHTHVLILSGGIDPVTPIPYGEKVAKALGSQAKHYTVKNIGHGLLAQGCVREVVNHFMSADDAKLSKIDASCIKEIPRPLAWLPPVLKENASGK